LEKTRGGKVTGSRRNNEKEEMKYQTEKFMDIGAASWMKCN
jgi:hypothetical protein